MNHTLAPWEHRHGGSGNYLDEVVATTKRGKKIVIARIPAGAKGRDAAFANARLIAAAPDMLAALDRILRQFDSGMEVEGHCICDARAAMEKATGKEQA